MLLRYIFCASLYARHSASLRQQRNGSLLPPRCAPALSAAATHGHPAAARLVERITAAAGVGAHFEAASIDAIDRKPPGLDSDV